MLFLIHIETSLACAFRIDKNKILSSDYGLKGLKSLTPYQMKIFRQVQFEEDKINVT